MLNVTIPEVIDAVVNIKSYCEHNNCATCPFVYAGGCRLHNLMPYEWQEVKDNANRNL